LQYMMAELLKNSCRATVKKWVYCCNVMLLCVRLLFAILLSSRVSSSYPDISRKKLRMTGEAKSPKWSPFESW
jgi:hypothetical protein